MNNGWLFPVIELAPRNRTLEDDPMEVPEVTCTPAIFPVIDLTMFSDRACVKDSFPNSWTAKPSAFFSRDTPKAVTTTSSRLTPALMATLMLELPLSATRSVSNPIKLNMSTSVAAFAVIEYVPSASVKTPLPCPETTTATPGMAPPEFRSVTLPVTFPWDQAVPTNSKVINKSALAFIWDWFI